MEKSSSNSQSPAPTTFIDGITKKNNPTVTAGGIGALYDALLRLDPDDVQQGVFFASVDTPVNKVRAVGYSRVKPAEIHFQTPNLQQGGDQLMGRDQLTGGDQLMGGDQISVGR